MNTLLTIAIPTFNRPKHVMARLKEISCLPSSIKEQVEVLICDNGKDRVNILELNKYDLNLKHFIHESNVGLGRNIESCILKATGKYVWLLSDDDKLVIKTFEDLFKILCISNAKLLILTDSDIAIDSGIKSDSISLEFWISLVFLSACIFNVETTKQLITGLNNSLMNNTYHQVLLGILMGSSQFKVDMIKNNYVIDTLTHKDYLFNASYTVRIGDFLLLERQLKRLGIKITSVTDHITSNILHYSPQIAFDFAKRNEFWFFFKSLICSKGIYTYGLKRILIANFSLLIYLLGLIDFRLARLFILMTISVSKTELLNGKIPIITIIRRPMKNAEKMNNAAKFGYSGDA